MVFDGIVISFVIALFRKGNLQGLSDLKLKAGWIFPLLLAVQLVVYSFQNDYKVLGQASASIYMVVYILGLVFLFINRNHRGFLVIFIGVFLNFLAMAINGGRMPVSAEAAAILDPSYIEALKEGLYAKHSLLDSSTKLGMLADIIPLTDPYPRTQVISIGDVVMNIGIFLFIQYLMVEIPKNKEVQDINMSTEGGGLR
ncbi:DUF5317 domain-containing protein [Mesobacillus subterraneus]|uniref:DUF5317 domain-containing protein n=1 Tax=Mesobacillus subterraneus TaxID=285983 RepID=UPI002042284C|nr:DUF5317 domain-containing protein [Mesobacillus subterraneus]MCM3663672.1 DUF5317 domain-containing protein [Mesobacillus subterraneus]MCM3683437.1 DUF5317 domain-containing protein [Mesobacillus subterraneus]